MTMMKMTGTTMNNTVERQLEIKIVALDTEIDTLTAALKKAYAQRKKVQELQESLDNIESKLKRV